MTHKQYVAMLIEMNACQEAVDWTRTQKSPQTAWDNCERGDWMLWLAGKCIGKRSRRKLVGAAAECARPAMAFEREQDKPAVENCLDLCDRFAAGDDTVTLDMLHAAAHAVAAAAHPAAAYAAAHAAAAYAAGFDDAAYVAAAAHAAAYAAADKAKSLRQSADIVRKWYPKIEDVLPRRKK